MNVAHLLVMGDDVMQITAYGKELFKLLFVFLSWKNAVCERCAKEYIYLMRYVYIYSSHNDMSLILKCIQEITL